MISCMHHYLRAMILGHAKQQLEENWLEWMKKG